MYLKLITLNHNDETFDIKGQWIISMGIFNKLLSELVSRSDMTYFLPPTELHNLFLGFLLYYRAISIWTAAWSFLLVSFVNFLSSACSFLEMHWNLLPIIAQFHCFLFLWVASLCIPLQKIKCGHQMIWSISLVPHLELKTTKSVQFVSCLKKPAVGIFLIGM